MQIVRFFTAFTLAALVTAIALDAEASPRPQPRDVSAEEIVAAVDEAQAMANQIRAERKAKKAAE